jgi:hypothetical protein
MAKARFKPKTLVLYATTSPSFFVLSAQIFRFNMKRLGIEVQVKYFGDPGRCSMRPEFAVLPSTS